MKIHSNPFLLLFIFSLLSVPFFLGCSESDTLDGSKEVYITVTPEAPFVLVGDTVSLHARVVNLGGSVIDTPVEWKSDDESVVRVFENKVVAQMGAQGKSTKVRAILKNGKYALVTVTVTRHAVNEVLPLVATHYTYSRSSDTVWFAIDPIRLLLDFEPVVVNSNPALVVPNPTSPVYVDPSRGRVGYVFSSSNRVGRGTVSLSIGAPGSEKRGSTEVVISPTIISSLGEDFNSITYEVSKTMNVNSVDTVWVNTKVDPTYEVDLKNAESLYLWAAEGNTAQMSHTGVRVVANRGHRAFAVLRSGGFTGQNVIVFECNGTRLTTTVDVQDYARQYPVEELTLDRSYVEIPVGSTAYITPTVKPISSYGIHIPVFTPSDRSMVQVVGYNGSEMGIRGLRIGESDVVVTSNDKSVTLRVKVTENVRSVVLSPNNPKTIFSGQSIQWFADVSTSSGSTIKPSWISSNLAVASIDSEGVIMGLSVGESDISAEAGGVRSAPNTLSVIAVPSSDLHYRQDNTNMNGNAVYIEGEKIVVVQLESLTAQPFKILSIFIKPTGMVLNKIENGTFTVADSQLSINVNGATADVTAGSITIKDGDDVDSKRIDGEITVTVGSASFKIKLTDLPAYL